MFIDHDKLHSAFLASARPHILMISNHGIHSWNVIPGLTDTGGQNIFVNRFTAELARLGFRVSIINRGGYNNPISGEMRRGLRYKDAQQRILYLEDNLATFVRKEDMAAQISPLAENLRARLSAEGTSVDLILSHYWDGAALGAHYNHDRSTPCKHIWIPHSLGCIKKSNVAHDQWEALRIDERIAIERDLIEQVDGITATSSVIQTALEVEYGYSGRTIFLPPCVDSERYRPRAIADDAPIWAEISKRLGSSRPADVRTRQIVTEISRTDGTKRKEVLLRAFARVQKEIPQSLLVIAIDEKQQPLAGKLQQLILDLGLKQHVAVVGSIATWLPDLYAISAVYCTPSVMEGFGMSAQEAAASGVPVVASHLVPFAGEYLLGTDVETQTLPHTANPLRIGAGAIVVQADDEIGFAGALTRLLSDRDLRQAMQKKARALTVPYFTWRMRVPAFLAAIGVPSDNLRTEEA